MKEKLPPLPGEGLGRFHKEAEALLEKREFGRLKGRGRGPYEAAVHLSASSLEKQYICSESSLHAHSPSSTTCKSKRFKTNLSVHLQGTEWLKEPGHGHSLVCHEVFLKKRLIIT